MAAATVEKRLARYPFRRVKLQMTLESTERVCNAAAPRLRRSLPFSLSSPRYTFTKRGTQGNRVAFARWQNVTFRRVLKDASTLQLNVTTSVSKRACSRTRGRRTRRKEHSEMFACETRNPRNSDREDLFLIMRENNFLVQSFRQLRFYIDSFGDFSLIFVTRDREPIKIMKL